MQTLHPNKKLRVTLVIGVLILLLIIDQVIKFYIKTTMALGDYHKIADWFYILFTENNGMAFGWEFIPKSALTLFRLVTSIGIGCLVFRTALRRYSMGLVICLTLILAGAVGNILDSLFYGLIFSHSYGQVATFLPDAGGYGTLLQGRVVDMFYFPIINTTWPQWIPILGGQPFVFFQPIFNFADACISVGVIVLVLFYAKGFTNLINSLSKKKASSRES